MIDPQQVKEADAPQLALGANELVRLANRIDQDYWSAKSDHDVRMRRFSTFYMKWRNRVEMPAVGEEAASNFRVPILQWQVFSKWAKEHASLFGADSEVLAKPIGPDDQRRVRKIGRFMTWRLFDSMRIQNPAAIFNFRKILFGRSHAYAPWRHETFDVPMRDGSFRECCSYDGPGFEPLWPDDFIVPAEDVKNLHEFSFVMRRYRATPDQLLDGEADGRYQQIDANFAKIIAYSNDRRRRDQYAEPVKVEKDLAEGVTYEGSLSAANSLQVWEWYGRWRMLKGKADAREDNLKRRDKFESDLCIRYLPELNLIVGAQDLAEMYPYTRNRRPFVEAALVEDGSYWGPGFGELLETIEEELSVNHNLMTDGGALSVGPVIFYRPASGFNPETFRYRPGTAVATEDPGGVKVSEFRANLEPCVLKEQAVIGYSERVTGLTDQNLGRVQDRPNAPRTARQTLALLEEGDVRASLDMSVLRESWGEILTHFWELERMYGSPNTFFRVTEEDAGGLFDTHLGGAYLDESELSGNYDFHLQFATSAVSKEQNKQNQLALYQIDLQNPLIVNNPQALWNVLDKIHKAFGDDRFSDLVPKPPDMGMPVDPKEEWTRLLEHEDINVNPLDNDQQHIERHNKDLVYASAEPDKLDHDAYRLMEHHILEHLQQMQQKKMMAALTSQLAKDLGGLSNQLPQLAGVQEQPHPALMQPGMPQPQKKAA
jgi:hypothetical protein